MGIGKEIADQVVAQIQLAAASLTFDSFQIARRRLPTVEKEDLSEGVPEISVVFSEFVGNEQDRSAEFLIYSISVVVACHVRDPNGTTADNVETFVEEIIDLLSDRDLAELTTAGGDVVELRLPVIWDPVFDPERLKDGVLVALSTFEYVFDKSRS